MAETKQEVTPKSEEPKATKKKEKKAKYVTLGNGVKLKV